MDLLTNDTQYQQYFQIVIFKETKTRIHSTIYHAKFSKFTKFHENSLQTNKYIRGLQIHREMYARRQTLPPGIHFFFKNWQVWGSIF